MHMQPFTSNSLKLLFIGIAVYLLSTFIPSVGNLFLDIIIRSAMITLLYISSIWYFKISEDINEMITSTLKKMGIQK